MPGRPLAVVTGASGGIGAATTRRLGADGYDVLMVARSAFALEKLGRDQGQGTGWHFPIACDLTRHDDVMRVAAELEARATGPVLLVNNAGTLGPIGRFGDIDFGEWSRTIDINLSGAARMTHACLGTLTAFPGSVVVNMSSGASSRPMNGWSAYCASKSGLAMFTRMLHLEYGTEFFTFGFQPGLVDTDMQARIRKDRTNEIGDIPRSGLLPPDDPAAIVSWLGRARPADLAGKEFRADDPRVRARAGLKD